MDKITSIYTRIIKKRVLEMALIVFLIIFISAMAYIFIVLDYKFSLSVGIILTPIAIAINIYISKNIKGYEDLCSVKCQECNEIVERGEFIFVKVPRRCPHCGSDGKYL